MKNLGPLEKLDDGKPVGLFIERNGLPISFDLFPSNTQDKPTFKETIKSKVNKFNTDTEHTLRQLKSDITKYRL